MHDVSPPARCFGSGRLCHDAGEVGAREYPVNHQCKPRRPLRMQRMAISREEIEVLATIWSDPHLNRADRYLPLICRK